MAHMLNDRGEVRFKFTNKLGDFVKPPFQPIQAGPQRSTISHHVIVSPRPLCAAFEHRIKVLRAPSESHGQRFQRSPAPPTLHRMPLDLTHDVQRDMRTLRELALTPAKLTDAIADNPSDRGPVLRIAFRHAFLRVPLPPPRLADHGAIPHKPETVRSQMKSFRNICEAEISYMALISAHEQTTAGPLNFLERIPEIPAPSSSGLLVFPPPASGADKRRQIDAVAMRIGAGIEVSSFRRHYMTSRNFGSVQYSAVAIPADEDKEQ